MTLPHHHSTSSDPTVRGRRLGEAFRAQVHQGFARYTGLFEAVGASRAQVAEWGERANAETEAWAPELAAEMAGIAEGAGLERWQLGALNGRTEILAAVSATGEGECSTSVVVPRDGPPPRTVQTWDWHDTMRGGTMIWSLEPRPGHLVHTFTEFGMVGKIGVNSAGLGVHFNVLRHHSDSAAIGVPVHVVARRVLDEATTIEEAAALARSARLSASSVITVLTYDGTRGAALGLELSPAGVAEVATGRNGTFAHTNHFVDPALAGGERTVAAESSTHERLARLRERSGGLAHHDLTRRAHALLSHGADGAPVCSHADPELPPHQRWETLATVSLDLAACRLAVHEGGPCAVTRDGWQWSPSPRTVPSERKRETT